MIAGEAELEAAGRIMPGAADGENAHADATVATRTDLASDMAKKEKLDEPRDALSWKRRRRLHPVVTLFAYASLN